MDDQLWQLPGYGFALNSKAFTAATLLPYGGRLALWIVLLGGLSQGIGQSIILFVNQVKPGNFSITAGKPADVELGRGLSREQRSGLTKE